MKKTILFSFLAFMAIGAHAQVTSLNEQFNSCDSFLDRNGTYNHYPSDGWSSYSVIGAQDWRCETDYGLGDGPCMHLNGYATSTNFINENWLIAPQLNLSSYAGSIYFNFAASYYYTGDSLHIMASTDYVQGSLPNFNNPDSSIYHWVELAHYGVMLYDTFYNIIGMYDEFQCDLTGFKTTPVYVAFKYTSSDSTGSAWDLDSVTTGTVSFGPIEGVAKVVKEQLPLKVIGMSTPDQMKLEFNVDEGKYDLQVYDIIGRKIYDEFITAQGGEQSYTINNLNLVSGMYIVRLGNESSYGVTKAVVQ